MQKNIYLFNVTLAEFYRHDCRIFLGYKNKQVNQTEPNKNLLRKVALKVKVLMEGANRDGQLTEIVRI